MSSDGEKGSHGRKGWQIEGTLEQAQRDAIVRALEYSGQNVSDAARRLRVGRSTLYRLMQRFDLRAGDGNGAADGAPIASGKRGAKPQGNIILVDGKWYIVSDQRTGS